LNSLIRAWADVVVDLRFPVIILSTVLIPLLLATGGEIPFDNSTVRYFVSDDPALEDYNQLLELFGDNEYLVVGIEASSHAPDAFTPAALDAMWRLSEFLEFHPYVSQLRSLSNYHYLRAEGDSLSVNPLIDSPELLARDSQARESIATVLAQEQLALNNLVSPDYRHLRILARVEYREDTSAHKVALVQDLYRFIEEEGLEADGYQLHLSGYPLVNERFETVSAQDIALLIPIMIAIMIVILYFCFRSIAAVILPWLVIACGLLSVLEIQYYIGIPHSTIDSSALVPTLIIIGIGITLHMLVEFFHFVDSERCGRNAAKRAVGQIWLPAFFTALTTSAGFLALSVTRIQPIREFALLGAMGPLLLFLFSLSTLPALLSFIDRPPRGTRKTLDRGWVSRFTRAIQVFTFEHKKPVLLTGTAIILFSVWNLPNVEIDNNYVTLFKQNSQTRQDIEYFDREFSGMMTLDVILDSGSAEGIKNPAFLADMEAVQSWLTQREKLGKITSLLDYLKEINRSMHGDDPEYYRLPDSAGMTAQYLLLYASAGSNEDFSDLRDFDNRYTRLIVPVVNMPASRLQEELNAIEAYLEREFNHLAPVVTGTMALYTVQDMYTATGMLQSFLTALAVISLFLLILFRSLRYGLLSLIPSVMPIVLAASMAGFLGIYLDQSAVIVFAMTMGIAVDDAIHVMSRYLALKKAGYSTQISVAEAMNQSGRAVIFSSIVLVCGFSVLCFGSFTTVIYVGLFGSVIMILALLGDLVFLPAMLYWLDDKRSNNLATSDQGGSTQ